MTPALRYHQRGAIQTAMRKATVVVAEGEAVQTAALTAAHAKKPLATLVHDIEQVERIAAAKVERLILTAAYLVPAYTPLNLPMTVAHNPFYAMRFATHTTRRYITIIGLTAPHLFYDIARAMPDRDFLAVKGAAGHQVLPPRGLKNMTVWPPQADRRNIYAQTAILVVPQPSAFWAPQPLEAAASGIPTVAAGADPVVQEALGDLATYVDSPQVADWVVALQGLQGPAYEALTRKLVAHAARQDPSKELAAFAQSLLIN
jgi:glycosyltransferase involved in cell wall biosynthesis